jgi:ATP-binding cassette subfamily F protein 3
MYIVKTKAVTKEWNGRPIFQHVTMDIVEGEKVALYGRNGVGKTTLLAMLRGGTEPDAGEVQRFVMPETWGWLEQVTSIEADTTTLDYVRGAS